MEKIKRWQTGNPTCTGCIFYRPFRKDKEWEGLTTHCLKRHIRSCGYDLRSFYDTEDFRCQDDKHNFIFVTEKGYRKRLEKKKEAEERKELKELIKWLKKSRKS